MPDDASRSRRGRHFSPTSRLGPGCVSHWSGAPVQVRPVHTAGEIARLPYGTQVTLAEVKGDHGLLQKPEFLDGGWIAMRRSGDGTALVSETVPRRLAKELEELGDPPPPLHFAVVVNPDGVLVRTSEEPGEGDILGTLPPGTAVSVVAVHGRRGQISSPLRGWVSLASASKQELVAPQRFQPGGLPMTAADRAASRSGVAALTWADTTAAGPAGWQRVGAGWIQNSDFDGSAPDLFRAVSCDAKVHAAPLSSSLVLRAVPPDHCIDAESGQSPRPRPVRAEVPQAAAEEPVRRAAAAVPRDLAGAGRDSEDDEAPAPAAPPHPELDPENAQVLTLRHTADTRLGLSLKGTVVTGVARGRAADHCGLEPGVRIIRIGRRRLSGGEDAREVRRLLAAAPPVCELAVVPADPLSTAPFGASESPARTDRDARPDSKPREVPGPFNTPRGLYSGPDSPPLSLSHSGTDLTSPSHRDCVSPPIFTPVAYPIGCRVDVNTDDGDQTPQGDQVWAPATVVGFDHRCQSYDVVLDTGDCSSVPAVSLRSSAVVDMPGLASGWPRGCFVLT
eukprot:TRINITY_DN15989_c0_g1_i1.p1 TRINITY_DN15989_c0_g1~~TRINITY_DN15989_c0_g1_i1.p1  ORF type:complete len:563 (+),score=139.13 TRINITY_DN15989_c0_g1_i1:55-1743(+)